MKYIQNLTKMKNNVQLEYNDPSGELHFGKPVRLSVTFRPEIIDTQANSVVFSGVTPVDDTVFAALQKERNFQYATSEKIRWLVVHDELPEFAQTPNDVMSQLREENANLRSRIAALEADNDGPTDAELDAVQGQLDTAVSDLEAANDDLATVNATLGEVKTAVAALADNKTLAADSALVAQITDLQAKIDAALGTAGA